MNKELCWNITSRCNQDCIYCFRALGLPECTLAQNMKILDYIRDTNVKELTWSGGEPFMYPHLAELLKKASVYNIKNKINTNASLFIPKIDSIVDYVDNFTFSLDSINRDINTRLGRGWEHYKNVDSAVTYLKNNHSSKTITINIVASRLNVDNIGPLIDYLNSIDINGVRVFQISPIRGRSIETYAATKISKEKFEEVKECCRMGLKVRDLTFRSQEDLEGKYLVISPDGSLCYNKNGQDILIKNLKEVTR